MPMAPPPDALLKRREELLHRLRAWPNLMRGSLYQRTRKCGRASCPCASGGPRHPARQLTVKIDKRMYARYVRDAAAAEVERLLSNYRELMDVIDELTLLN